MQATRRLLRSASQAVTSGAAAEAIPAPKVYEPASKAPSPLIDIIVASGLGLSFAVTYKMWYWNWKKELNQFYYEYDKTMAEHAPGSQ